MQIQEFKSWQCFFQCSTNDCSTCYLFVFSLPLFHSFQTFQSIDTYHFEEHDFVLKPQVVLIELEPDSIHIMCS
jgi:hypothetical protein